MIWITSLLGGGLAWKIRLNSTYWVRIILGFSGAYLLSMCVLHLLPEIFEHPTENPWSKFFILGGFFLQLVVEYFSKGIEHGHIHHHPQGGNNRVYVIMIGLGIHGLVEGLPLSGTGFHHNETVQNMYIGIMLHHIPSAFVLVTMLKNAHFSTRTTLLVLLVTASMIPLGGILGGTVLNSLIEKYFNYVLSVVVGVFLHLSTTILFESAEPNHQYRFRKFVAVCSGIVLAALTSFL